MAGREPASLSSGDVPSSFDSDPEFFEEGRAAKLWRKLRQEPLIPLGGLATCYALYQATKSIRHGDHHQTNKMFRARIYAQGFTLVALVAGSIFYQDERLKRRSLEKAVEQKKSLEKRDKWIAELEARDVEDRAWRERIERESGEAMERAGRAAEKVKSMGNTAKQAVEETFSSKLLQPAGHSMRIIILPSILSILLRHASNNFAKPAIKQGAAKVSFSDLDAMFQRVIAVIALGS